MVIVPAYHASVARSILASGLTICDFHQIHDIMDPIHDMLDPVHDIMDRGAMISWTGGHDIMDPVHDIMDTFFQKVASNWFFSILKIKEFISIPDCEKNFLLTLSYAELFIHI